MTEPSVAQDRDRSRLDLAARAASARAYAPYSQFRVGAAVLTAAGGVFGGCNVENASYGLTACAERNAVATAVLAEGAAFAILAVRIVTADGRPVSPCGACRQIISEFGPTAMVVFDTASGPVSCRISELLPHGFAAGGTD